VTHRDAPLPARPASAAIAQVPADDPHAACAAVGYVPRELLEKPVALRDGTGAGRGRGQAHDPVTTASPEAQAFYDQGVAYLHSYVWIEAARAFRQALRLDPKLALAHVGLSRVATALEDKQAAWQELEQAEALATGATPRERRRIALRRIHLAALEELASVEKHAAYKKALDDALAQALVASRFAAARALGHVTLAQVALSSGSLGEARAEAARAQREFEAVEPGPSSARNALLPYLDLVKGSLQLRGEPVAGRGLLEDVGRRLRALPGPDAWMQALFVLESIARTAREASDWKLAERMARQMLEHDRAYAGGHYALGLVAEQRGDAASTQEAFATAARLWAQADGDLRSEGRTPTRPPCRRPPQSSAGGTARGRRAAPDLR